MPSKHSNNFFAEILESNLTTWHAQTWQWNDIPSFGSLVTAKAHNRTLFGIITDITTGPTDPIRQPITYQKTEEELQKEQPQIFEFLKTSFQCLTIGYQENNNLIFQIPPQPPKIHTFIAHATDLQHELCLTQPDFLPMLLSNNGPNVNFEELLLAILQGQLKRKKLSKDQLQRFIETFFTITSNNYHNTKMFSQRVEKLLLTFPIS